ncbi:MAG: restriction endonuclease subunit S [Pseudomonadota bacterium]|nr:restriction endonuclease subunit S [Pseudomonadota bacterium]
MKVKEVSSAIIDKEGRRLDCGPYMSGAIETKELLKKLRAKKDHLRSLTENGIGGIINPGRITRIWVDDPAHGYPFLSSTDILHSDLSNVSLIAKSAAKKNRNLLLKKNSTLITRSGAIGRMTFARAEMDGMACTEDVLRVIPDESKVLPGFVFAYLSSRFGVPLIASGTYGSIITHLEPHHIADLPVPRLGNVEELAHELVFKAGEELTESSHLMTEATAKLFKYAGLSESMNHEFLSDHRRYGWEQKSTTLTSLRGLNYDPRSAELIAAVTNIRHDKLGSLVDRSNFEGHIVFKRIDADPEHAVMLVGQRDAFQLRPDGRWISRKSIEGLGLQVPSGTTVIPCHGTLGESELYCRATLVTERTAQYAYSGDFYRCIPKDGLIAPGYLYAYLRSRFAFRIIRAMSTGSKQQYQHPALMANMAIPRLSKEKEAEIAAMVDRAAQLRDHAIDLEDRAVALVENAIEEEGR